MAEEIKILDTDNKKEKYINLLPQIEGLLAGEEDLIANLANIAAALKQSMGFFWVGFYLSKGNELVLGPFQGPVACTRIGFGKGVCGTAMAQKKSIIVPDVDQFPGHIACNSVSRSEIVIPFVVDGTVQLMLDVDSDQLDDFDATDEVYLSKIVSLVNRHFG